MAALTVTHDVPVDTQINVNRNLTVTVDSTGFGDHVYMRVTRGGIRAFDVKVMAFTIGSFDVIKNDTVAAFACGDGVIQVSVA